jgi:hypothetical protein
MKTPFHRLLVLAAAVIGAVSLQAGTFSELIQEFGSLSEAGIGT